MIHHFSKPLALLLLTPALTARAAEAPPQEKLPPGAKVVKLEAKPAKIALANPYAYAQLLVTGTLSSGETVDLTRMVDTKLSTEVAEVSRSGLVRPSIGSNSRSLLKSSPITRFLVRCIWYRRGVPSEPATRISS